MNIVVIGAGALGSVYGSFLSESDSDVLLLTKREEHAKAINKSGILIENHIGQEKVYKPKASSDPNMLSGCDFIIVLVKTYNTEAIGQLISKHAAPNSTILTLQSGLGNTEALSEKCGKSRILSGVSYLGVRKINDNKVVMGENLQTVIGEPSGEISERLEKIAGLFRRSGIEVKVSQSIKELIWGKMIVITAQNALGAVTGFTFEEMLKSEYCRKIITGLLSELKQVANKAEVKIPDDLVRRVHDNWKTLPGHRVSMWQDLQKGRPTEVDAINGAIAKLGGKYNVSTPWNIFITNLIHMLEEKNKSINKLEITSNNRG